jgi:hypothetical protein
MESENLLTMTDAQKQAVAEALEEYRADPGTAVDWSDVREHFLS